MRSTTLIGGWQIAGDVPVPERRPGRQLGNIIFTGNLDDIALSASERTRLRWFNAGAGFNKDSTQQLASNVRTFPLRLDDVRTHETNNVDLSLIKNMTIVNGENAAAPIRSAERVQPRAVPGPGAGRDGGDVRRGRDIDAGELLAPRPGNGEVHVLRMGG